MNLRFFNKDVPLRNLVFVIGEGLLIYLAILTAAFLRLGYSGALLSLREVLAKASLIMVVCQCALYYNELYNLKVTDTSLELGLRLTKAMGVASVGLALIYYFSPSLMMPRGIFFIGLPLIIILIVPWRYAYKWTLKKRMFAERIAILGTGDLCRRIIDEMKTQPDVGYEVVALLSTDSPPKVGDTQGIPVLSIKGTLLDLVDRLRVKKIVVAMDEKRGALPVGELLRCKMEGISVLEGVSLYEEMTGKVLVQKIIPSDIIFSQGFRKSRMTLTIKRATGLLLATIGLFLAFPLLVIIAIAIKLDSKGPVLYCQNRCGAKGRVFKVFKFRSMRDKAEAQSGPVWAKSDDERITRVGRILRNCRLDELPQLWNVLKGDMSFVGPRPERPEFVEKLGQQIPYYLERHSVKPGITGWAQVCYRYGASVEDTLEKLEYDLFYVKNMSFALDMLIIFKTLKIVLLQDGAR